MKYFENPQTTEVFAYDETNPSQIPYMDKAIESGYVEVTGAYPTNAMKENNCKWQATALLAQTDWSVLPDVTTGTPALTNQADFIVYRNQIRELAVNPVADPIWPIEPTPIWS